ncbi:MAG: carboxypeptidase-like regulatory domain-containing protein [Phycisphaerales bacterium]
MCECWQSLRTKEARAIALPPAAVDPNGRFILTGLTSGTHQLRVIASEKQTQDWFGQDPVVTIQAGQTASGVTLTVNRGAILEVMIQDPNGDAGVEGARVNVSATSFDTTGTTDANGLARLRVPAGRCRLSGGKLGYGIASPERIVLLDKGQTHREQMPIIGPAVYVMGTVIDSRNQPVASASVLHWPMWHAASADRDGRFEYTYYTTGSGDRHEVCVREGSLGLAGIVELSDPSGGRRPTGRITLQPAHSLVGRVVDPNGVAIPAAHVRLMVCSPQRTPRRIIALAEVVTDGGGTYEIRGIPTPPADFAAHYYAVVAHAAGYNEASVEPVPLAGPVEEPIHVASLTLAPTDRIVSGIVVDANDKPVPKALVSTPKLEASDRREDAIQPHRRVLSDAQGRFRIEGVCKGPIQITATTSAPTQQEGVTETLGGEDNAKIVLGRTLLLGKSSAGKRITDWAGLGLFDRTDQLRDKAVLLCFVDLQQRSCRHAISQLAGQSKLLADRNVIVAGIPFSKGESAEPEPTDAVLMAKPPGDPEALRQAWGIQSLPWLVLMDGGHVVRAEGFSIAELPSKLAEISADR